MSESPAFDKAFAVLASDASHEEVRQALNTFAHELAEEIRNEVPQGYCPCADTIDPEVSDS